MISFFFKMFFKEIDNFFLNISGGTEFFCSYKGAPNISDSGGWAKQIDLHIIV